MAPLVGHVLLSACCAWLAASPCTSKQVTISNVVPRRDVHGVLMDAHDGKVVQWERGGLYYWYGMRYGNVTEAKTGCFNGNPQAAGFRKDHNISVWTSPDLVSWDCVEEEALKIADRPLGIYFRPKVVYNKASKLYVLWANYMHYPAPYSKGYYLTATSATPEGPFKIHTKQVTMSQASGILCDFDIFVDDDGTAYMIYTVWRPVGPPAQSTHMSVERLSADYLSSTLNASAVFTGLAARADEAPVMLKRRGVYYAMFGHGCCFCAAGSGVNVLTSPLPLGPYSSHSYDVACAANEAITNCSSVSHSQQSYVFDAHTATGVQQIWTGDRWQSAPDHEKSHDFQYWYPLQWDDSVTPSKLRHITWIDNFTLDLDLDLDL